MEFIVHYKGYYVIEADSEEEALESCRDDGNVSFESWENTEIEVRE